MKKAMLMGLAALTAVVLVACGARQTNAPTAGETTTENASISSVTAFEASTLQPVVSESAAATSVIATSASSGAAISSSAGKTSASTKATTTTAKPSVSTVTAARTTTTAAPAQQTQSPKPVYTEADYAEIIAAVRAYAESKTAVKFIWNPELTYEYANRGLAGYHDVVNLSWGTKESTIQTLKYNADLTEDVVSNPLYGVPSDQVYFNVVWFYYEGAPHFALIYG